ncbi:CLUMA_CG014522, isoform A [Clunio marinus]|uniref:CLUMA_CG014522, isoform A n=1 Tax=Clunio marinus TaxID=568069 RepID=A0A1J1ILD5_9DIPT|nr:CLUMA_CG014522, isoform A [Clunio marinus]
MKEVRQFKAWRKTCHDETDNIMPLCIIERNKNGIQHYFDDLNSETNPCITFSTFRPTRDSFASVSYKIFEAN